MLVPEARKGRYAVEALVEGLTLCGSLTGLLPPGLAGFERSSGLIERCLAGLWSASSLFVPNIRTASAILEFRLLRARWGPLSASPDP